MHTYVEKRPIFGSAVHAQALEGLGWSRLTQIKAYILSFRLVSKSLQSNNYWQRTSPSKLGHTVLGNREGFFKTLVWAQFVVYSQNFCTSRKPVSWSCQVLVQNGVGKLLTGWFWGRYDCHRTIPALLLVLVNSFSDKSSPILKVLLHQSKAMDLN